MAKNNQPIKPMTAVPKKNYAPEKPITPAQSSKKAPLYNEDVQQAMTRAARQANPSLPRLTPEQTKKLSTQKPR